MTEFIHWWKSEGKLSAKSGSFDAAEAAWDHQGSRIAELEARLKEQSDKMDSVIDMCDLGHKFAKLPDHPLRDGHPRCPHCMATGIDSMKAGIAELDAQLKALQKEEDDVADYLKTLTDRCIEDTTLIGVLKAQLKTAHFSVIELSRAYSDWPMQVSDEAEEIITGLIESIERGDSDNTLFSEGLY